MAAEAPQHVLPAGSTVVFLVDGHLDPTAKPGSSVPVRLRSDLVLDGETIATAGTQARLVTGGLVKGTREIAVTVEGFTTKLGLLPLRPAAPTLPAIDQGLTFSTTTLARVVHLGDRFAIEVPFPYALSNDTPLSVYTPTPAKTASPRITVGPAPEHTPIVRGTPAGAPTPYPDATGFPH